MKHETTITISKDKDEAVRFLQGESAAVYKDMYYTSHITV